MDNCCGGRPKSSWAPPKAMRGKCEHRRGNINAGAANAEVFAGDEHSRERLFDPMAAISRRWRGGRIYNNTRTRVLLRRKCVKPADLTAHSRRRSAPAPHSDAHCPSIFSPPSRTLPLPSQRRCTPADHTTHSPSKICSRPRTATRTARAFSHPLPAHFHSPSQRRCTPAGCAMHSSPTSRPIPRRRTSPFPQRRPASPSVPLRAQKNGTAQWMCDAECLGRPSLRSVIGVGEPRAVRRRCGALAWRVGLRPRPWALRSRRCGRVLRA